jgi:hypothetical protein
MRLIVEILRVVQCQRESHIGREVLPIEVVVPSTTLRHHKETQELV